MRTNSNNKRLAARRRVEELKGFYIHATVYVLVNIAIIAVSVTARMSHGDSFTEAFFNIGSFFTAIFWGIGLAFHASKAFRYNPFFGKDWEQRKIRQFMEEDQKEAERFGKRT